MSLGVKRSLTKESLIVGILLVGVLVFSSFASFAYAGKFDLKQYVKNADYYTSQLSDETLLGIIYSGLAVLSTENRETLSSFSNENFLDVARGTEEGKTIASSLNPEETRASEELLSVILNGQIESQNNGNYFALWGKPKPAPVAPPKCPAKLGACTPGQLACMEFELPLDVGACEYTCGPAGTWVPTLRCPTQWCNANRCM
ncbi:hypothetical protein CO038_02120 [Candidatus Pacearchaeota archaeon CG_4_9_14_0_2_um_filter_39_13]|nr:hypothetical protein [Candidatus Pacearchaeota archaeon]OIO43893.1 MAG: hypothetical protein AUJ64_01175 [Candidatus Pacearchaeota archaeon CG1_02_39_14]PJC44742.1 MAG: hypothetical protein CO038_02120 [Candidatus Pacearchaeota archaeon CG_4_9_14_0_2_um_filter_39_13]